MLRDKAVVWLAKAHEWLRRKWIQLLAALPFLPLAAWLFLAAPWLVVALAVVPLEQWLLRPLQRKVRFGQVVAILLSAALGWLLFFVSWWAAEIVVVLASVACVQEIARLCVVLARWLDKTPAGQPLYYFDGSEPWVDVPEAAV
jgi:hypothetical protein